MKKQYVKPQLEVMKMQHQGMLCASGDIPAATQLGSQTNENFNWVNDGMDDDIDDF